MPGGFTLIELAIVMFIVTLLLGGMLLPLAGQQDIRNHGDTQKIMADAVSMPVAGQGFSNDAAWLLAVAGPLWLTWVLWVSIQLVRKPVA